MRRGRGWVARWTPAVLALFVGTVAAPRPGLLVHHHAGGDTPHVHLDDHAGADDDHDHDDFPGAHAPLRPGEVALRATDDDGWHWHASQPFQRGVAAAPAGIVSTAFDAVLHASYPRALPRRLASDLRARAPPAPSPSLRNA